MFTNSLSRYCYTCYFTSIEIKKGKHGKVKDSAIITQLTHSGTRIQIQAVIPEHMLFTVILCFHQHSTGVDIQSTLDLLLNS